MGLKTWAGPAASAAFAVMCWTLVACGGSDEALPTGTGQAFTPTATAEPASQPPATPTTPVSPVPSPSPAMSQDLQAATAAATRELDAVLVNSVTTGCTLNNPAKKPCIELRSSSGDAERGVVHFGMADPLGPGGTNVFFARMSDGSWRYWFGTQNLHYRITRFPADGFVCAQGDQLNVRDRPATSGAVITRLNDLAAFRAEEFVLTVPGTVGGGASAPDGWYRISSPAEGWINYRFASVATLETCEVHNLAVGTS